MKRVFIAEDNTALAKIYATVFARSGYAVEVARDGEEALAKLSGPEAEWPCVILLDMTMPKKGGLEVLTELQNMPVFAKTPVVALTNIASLAGGPADLEKAKQLGACDVILKSQCDPQDVVKRVERFIS